MCAHFSAVNTKCDALPTSDICDQVVGERHHRRPRDRFCFDQIDDAISSRISRRRRT
jgi:hypothetical protein